MRWLCFLFASAAAAQGGAPPVKPLHFDFSAIPVTRDSFVFLLDGKLRGYAVWQYERRSVETRQEIIYTQHSEFPPVVEEDLRVVLDALSGTPISAFHRFDMSLPASDTTMREYDLDVRGDTIKGRRRVLTKKGPPAIIPVHHTLPAGAVFAEYELYAAAVTNAAPGDSLMVPAYSEFGDSLATLTFVAGDPVSIQVPAGRFDVLPLRSGSFRLYVTRQDPRRVVKGETIDSRFSFELAHSGPVVPTQP
jgi:hypothetical protein